jgi:hypothetical protein
MGATRGTFMGSIDEACLFKQIRPFSEGTVEILADASTDLFRWTLGGTTSEAMATCARLVVAE